MVAVDGKIEEQRKFYAWWKANVTGQGTRTDLSRERGQSLAQSDAEDLTGMKHQRVSPFSFENDDFLYDAHPNLAAPPSTANQSSHWNSNWGDVSGNVLMLLCLVMCEGAQTTGCQTCHNSTHSMGATHFMRGIPGGSSGKRLGRIFENATKFRKNCRANY
jgi:hypothetical protein